MRRRPSLLRAHCFNSSWREHGRKADRPRHENILGQPASSPANPPPNSKANSSSYKEVGGAWLAQSVQHATLDLRIVSSGPMLDVEFTGEKMSLKKVRQNDNNLRLGPK